MIFVTTGTQLPFDRLMQAMHSWSVQNPGQTIVSQTGAGRGDYEDITCHAHLTQAAFQDHIQAADIIVAHAGMGSILMASEAGKPIVIMPRRADLGEHRNDHQQGTAQEMAALPNVYVASDAAALCDILDRLVAGQSHQAQPRLASTAQPQLLYALRSFVWDLPPAMPVPPLQQAAS